jgi:hypothetical protein
LVLSPTARQREHRARHNNTLRSKGGASQRSANGRVTDVKIRALFGAMRGRRRRRVGVSSIRAGPRPLGGVNTEQAPLTFCSAGAGDRGRGGPRLSPSFEDTPARSVRCASRWRAWAMALLSTSPTMARLTSAEPSIGRPARDARGSPKGVLVLPVEGRTTAFSSGRYARETTCTPPDIARA